MADEDNMEFDFEEQLDVQPEVVPPAGDQVRLDGDQG